MFPIQRFHIFYNLIDFLLHNFPTFQRYRFYFLSFSLLVFQVNEAIKCEQKNKKRNEKSFDLRDFEAKSLNFKSR